MKKKLGAILLVAALVLSFGLLPVGVSAFSQDTLLFEDDFESYSVGGIPSAKWWTYAYEVGGGDQRVRSFGGSKALRLYAEGWVASAFAKTTPLLNSSIEADLYMTPRSSGTIKAAALCLRANNYGTAHSRGGYNISYDPDDDSITVTIVDYPNTNTLLGQVTYEIEYYTWYKMKALVFGDTYGDITIQVFVDDMVTPVLEVVDDGSKWENHRGDTAGYFGLKSNRTGPLYFDNVKIYEVTEGIPVNVDAEAGGNPLNVTVDWSYDGSTGTNNTPYTIDDIPDGNIVTLTAPLIHIEGSNVYSFLGWDVGDNNALGVTSFDVNADITATASYQELQNFVTGGGNIKSEVVKGNRTIQQVDYTFGGNVGISDVHGIVGNFQIVDHTGVKPEAWHCTTDDFIYLAFGDVGDIGAETPESSNDTAIIIIGDFSSNRGNEATLVIVIWDSQEPGTDSDTIFVGELVTPLGDLDNWIGSLFSPETLSGGNFQLHDYE